MWLQIHSRYIYRRLTWPDIIDYKLRRLRTRLWHSKIYSNDLAFNSDFYAVHFLRDSLSFSNFRPFTLHHPTPGNAWTVLMRRVVCAPRQYSSWCQPLFRSVPSKRKPFRTLPTCGGQRFGEGTRILHHRQPVWIAVNRSVHDSQNLLTYMEQDKVCIGGTRPDKIGSPFFVSRITLQDFFKMSKELG